MIIIASAIKIHHPEVYQHLRSLSVPLEWYFYDSFSQFFSNVLPSEALFRLWDMLILNISTTNEGERKRALWYLLAIPIYMVEKNAEQILMYNDPSEIKELLLNSTASLIHSPNDFMDELIALIKKVFVINEDLFSKLLGTASTSRLES